MTPREITKKIAGIVVQIGSGTIVHGIITTNVEPKNVAQKATIAVASFAIGGLVAERAVSQSDKIVDNLFDEYEKIMKKIRPS
jgi:hypothetical protein